MIKQIRCVVSRLNTKYILALLMITLATGCGMSPLPDVGPLELPAEKKIPDLEIVFFESESQLGFVDPEGTQYRSYTIDLSSWYRSPGSRPTLIEYITWDSAGELLVGGYTGSHRSSSWPIIITRDGKLVGCSPDVSPYSPYRLWSFRGEELLVVDKSEQEGRVVIFDIASCEIIEILYIATNPQYENLTEAALSSQGWLAIGRYIRTDQRSGDELILLNPNGVITTTIPDGNYPSWSKDGEWVAFYKATDGLYIARKDGSEMRQVVTGLEKQTLASWSPDGKWLVFDVTLVDSEGLPTSVIYKVNIENGDQIELHRGGYNPSWRWGS